MPSASAVIDRCEDSDIELVRLLYVGNDGVTRGYIVNPASIPSILDDGMNLTKGMQSFNALDQLSPSGPFGPDGSVRLIPDPATFTELPYAERSALMLCEMETVDGRPWGADPRGVLSAFLDELDIVPAAAFESEFYLIERTPDGLSPIEDSVCFSPEGMQLMHDFVLDLKRAIEAQEMGFVTYYPEYGPGQQEFVIKHAEGVRAADNHVRFTQTAKAVAINHGYKATFIPKPFGDAAGSGCHIHLSVWDEDGNVFFDPDADDAYPLGRRGRQFIGGILEHARALTALTAPTVISYKRLRPHMWASAFSCWGNDNREAIVRVPFAGVDDREGSTRIEFKPADNTANPYIALLGLLAAGFDGIEREIDPGDPVEGDPGAMSPQTRSQRGIDRLPETLGEALDALEEDETLTTAMGDLLFESYVDAKRSQLDAYHSQTSEWEIESLIRAF